MVKKYISLLFVLLPCLMQAQVSCSVTIPPAGMIRKEQLWNLVVVNNTNATLEATIAISLRDAVTGLLILTGGSRTILLGKGVKMITDKDVQPVQYDYGMAGLTGNFLPLGSYIACFTITRNGTKGPETVANECVRININPLSPPLLNTPADRSVLQHPVPQFTWTPPAPVQLFDDLNYDISVAEVLTGQSPAEAILYNTPLYTTSRLKASFQTYPSTWSTLQPGKTYAWQVTARNGLNYAAPTEVWTFSVAKDSAKTATTAVAYVSLSNNNLNGQGVHYITGNNLNLKYYSFDKEHAAVVQLYNAERKLLQEIKQTIVYGDNFLQLNLNRQFRPQQVYTVVITDLQNNTHSASFSISNQAN
ncbi:hypothetical protein FAM09_29705 [Niastella caeni]|uniref:Fibronectin type-III domain-containing protein n=1 Tax=Niastella caeni TaxID=2569763 RepID=A0A4S8H7F9_9BACT|nr:hypothetical protein [Niastella caeni]THU30778.1 hypothetical protein FAM09_29705 [Niastella caeni]